MVLNNMHRTYAYMCVYMCVCMCMCAMNFKDGKGNTREELGDKKGRGK